MSIYDPEQSKIIQEIGSEIIKQYIELFKLWDITLTENLG